MRIAGGEWRGRNLRVPQGDAVRPTQDRVREALFSMLQFELEGASSRAARRARRSWSFRRATWRA